jgi:hypothetical protein
MEKIFKIQPIIVINDWLEVFPGKPVAIAWDKHHNKEEAYELYEYFKNQPERSKREDSIVSEIKSDVHAKMMKPLLDAYEMRCSELYGNIET